MVGYAHPLRLILLVAIFGPAAIAQNPPPAVPTATEPVASPKLTRLFAGALPKYAPPKPESAAPATVSAGDRPRNGIIRLPTYLVREARPISDEDVLTQQGRESAMARRYLGPQAGLDRTLNAVTLAGLWKSIPVVGRVPFIPFESMTYEERAALIYERPERKRRYDELLSIEQFARDADKTKAPDKTSK